MFSEKTVEYTAAASRPATRTRFTILAMILLLATVAYADRAILSIAGPGISKAFGLDHIQLGYILSAFSWAYVIGQIPGGLLLDRFGTKIMYGVTLTLWSIATILVGFVGQSHNGRIHRARPALHPPIRAWLHRSPQFPCQ